MAGGSLLSAGSRGGDANKEAGTQGPRSWGGGCSLRRRRWAEPGCERRQLSEAGKRGPGVEEKQAGQVRG